MPIDTDTLAVGRTATDKAEAEARVFTVPNCYRSWSFHANTLGVGCFQVHHARSYKNETRMEVLCEVYSRAIFETCISQHFDETDSRVDALILRHIRDAFGPGVALDVHDAVAKHGPVARPAEKCFE